MSSSSISTVFNELFSTPLKSVAEAESNYRKIWADWIEFQIPLFKGPDGTLTPEAIQKMFDLAPVVKLDGLIEVGITMRIAEVKESTGSVSGGLQIGPIHASGSFGFSKQSSQESVFQASTRFTISNQQTNLKDYLAERNIVPTNAEALTEAVSKLKTNGEG